VKLAPHRTDRILQERGDNRSPGQRDRDRILYTSAFQRLAEVTQVVTPDEGHVFHNRLTHSLKVAQVARRTAERLLSLKPTASRDLDPDVVEAAALAHDLGHPPFGHIAEEELNKLVTEDHKLLDGFNGNAQSFRIVTKLSLRSEEVDGLNLSRATLNAILKYPWMRNSDGKKGKRWGAYSIDKQAFEFARAGSRDESKCLEADLMDLADDVTYAVHDLADFFRAGMIPLDRLSTGKKSLEMGRFLEEVFAREVSLKPRESELKPVFYRLLGMFPLQLPYSGTNSDRSSLRAFTAGLIATYIRDGIKLSLAGGGVKLIVLPETEMELTMLKQLTWHYVILNPSLATQQHGQRRVIHDLFTIFRDAADHPEQRPLFPFAFREFLERSDSGSDPERAELRTRVVCDYIAGMTEKQALQLHLKLTGVRPGSALH
jgi:dGTPase